MRSKIIAALGLLALTATTANALDLNVTYSRIPSHWYLDRGPRIIHVPPGVFGSEAERTAEIARWESYCQPKRNTDALGVVRLSYAHPGCEFGRSAP
jgi:hypothetical protein